MFFEKAIIDTLITLSSVTVVGTKEGAVPEQTMDHAQIQGIASTSVADALKFFSGVQIKDYGGLGGQKTINVRSLGTQHTGVYIDGVRITNCQNGIVDLGKFSLSTMESVSLYNSNKTAPLMFANEYASASTIYLTSHRPDSTAFTAKYGYGSFNTHRSSLHYDYRKTLSFDAEYVHSDGDYKFKYHSEYEDTVGYRRNSDIDAFRIESSLWFNKLQAHAYLYHSERGIPGGVLTRLSEKFADVGREWDTNAFGQLTYNDSWGAHSLRATARYSHDYLHFNSDYAENMSVHRNLRYTQNDVYGAVAYALRLPYVTLTGTTDLRWSDLTCNVMGFSYVARVDSKSAVDAQFTYKGVKFNASILYTNIQDHTKMPADRLSKFSPTLHFSYDAGRLKLRAFYKNVFRAPTLNDLYYTQVGRRTLRPENTRQIDVGMTYATLLPAGSAMSEELGIKLQVDAYHNRVTDRIVCMPSGSSYDWRMTNYGETRGWGVDASLRISYGNHELFVTGTWQNDRDYSSPGSASYKQRLIYSPEWSATGVYTYSHKRWVCSLSHMFVAKRYWTQDNTLEAPLPAYNSTDAKVQYKFSRSITASVECQNIFNIQAELLQRWPLPLRQFMATVSYTF